MKPYYDSEGITIFCADCREVLSTLSDFSICLTSPPYNVNLSYTDYHDSLSDEAFQEFNREWIAALVPALAESARVYACVADKMLWWFRGMAEAVGLTWAQLIPWCKPNLASGRIGGDWNAMVEWFLLFRKGKRTPMLNGIDCARMVNTHNYIVAASPQSNWSGQEQKQHPAQWPLEVPLRLLARTPGLKIVDPFMGSGSALVAAKTLGRGAVGIDVSEQACEVAAKRLSQRVFNFGGGNGQARGGDTV